MFTSFLHAFLLLVTATSTLAANIRGHLWLRREMAQLKLAPTCNVPALTAKDFATTTKVKKSGSGNRK
jgi:hypothetical protein